MKINTRPLDKVVAKLIKKICGNGVRVAMGTDFCFYYPCRIEYSILVSERMDNLFLEYAKAHGLKVNCGVFVLSLLHEVGHYFTIDEVDDMEYLKAQDIKAELTDSDEDCKIYFDLADERVATEWAINYINSHEAELKAFAEDFQKALVIFIKKYDLQILE